MQSIVACEPMDVSI